VSRIQILKTLVFICYLGVKWSSDAAAKTYYPVAGNLIKKVHDPDIEMVPDAARQRERRVPAVQIYSSLEGIKVTRPSLSVDFFLFDVVS